MASYSKQRRNEPTFLETLRTYEESLSWLHRYRDAAVSLDVQAPTFWLERDLLQLRLTTWATAVGMASVDLKHQAEKSLMRYLTFSSAPREKVDQITLDLRTSGPWEGSLLNTAQGHLEEIVLLCRDAWREFDSRNEYHGSSRASVEWRRRNERSKTRFSEVEIVKSFSDLQIKVGKAIDALELLVPEILTEMAKKDLKVLSAMERASESREEKSAADEDESNQLSSIREVRNGSDFDSVILVQRGREDSKIPLRGRYVEGRSANFIRRSFVRQQRLEDLMTKKDSTSVRSELFPKDYQVARPRYTILLQFQQAKQKTPWDLEFHVLDDDRFDEMSRSAGFILGAPCLSKIRRLEEEIAAAEYERRLAKEESGKTKLYNKPKSSVDKGEDAARRQEQIARATATMNARLNDSTTQRASLRQIQVATPANAASGT